VLCFYALGLHGAAAQGAAPHGAAAQGAAAQGAAAQLCAAAQGAAAHAAGAHAPFLPFLAFLVLAWHALAEQAEAAQQPAYAAAGADAMARPPEMARRAISLLAFDIIILLDFKVSEIGAVKINQTLRRRALLAIRHPLWL
jgi:hypothetical protein